MTFIPNREELAWAAGFFDGEGSTCGGVSRKGAAWLTMPIHQLTDSSDDPNSSTLERFRNAVGGLGRIYERRERADMHVWTVGAFEDVQAVGAMLWPFLSQPKQKQFSKALEARKAHGFRRQATGHPKGVYFDKRYEKWYAYSGVPGTVFLGAFTSEKEAVDARNDFLRPARAS
jgi:hypothetical protein